MSTTIETPGVDEVCVYCESQIFDHEPICVRDCTDDCGSAEYFCNHACISAHIDQEGLTTGDACEWNPDGNNCC